MSAKKSTISFPNLAIKSQLKLIGGILFFAHPRLGTNVLKNSLTLG